MQQACSGMNDLSYDLVLDILGRLDGSTVASAGCTCSTILQVGCDQRLWQQLCHSTWPSTALEETRSLFSCSSYDRFYADSYPLILYNKLESNDTYSKPTLKCLNASSTTTPVCLSDFASLIDIYYENQCILSRVCDGIPEVVKMLQGDGNTCCNNCGRELRPDNLNQYEYDEDNCNCFINPQETPDLPTYLDNKKIKENDGHTLVNNLRLSWVLLHKKTGKSVNLSSWKPVSIRTRWLSDGSYVLQFGSIIPISETEMPHNLAKCSISATCKLTPNIKCKEISIHIEDIRGAHISIQQAIQVMMEAIHSPRSGNHQEVIKSYQAYEEKKQELIKNRVFQDKLADWLCMSIQITVFVICFYSLIKIQY